jgi:hypothetical protein
MLCSIPVILATPGMEIGRILVQRPPRQKVIETPISTKKLSMVEHVCHPSYTKSISRRILGYSATTTTTSPWKKKYNTLPEK